MFILDPVKGLLQLDHRIPESEDLLQGLLAAHPNLLGNDGQFRLLLIRREMSVPDAVTGKGRWSLDHLYVDQDGVPTLVETKRASNSQVRREVVGQMLDYAANAVEYWSVEKIKTEFEHTCTITGVDELTVLRDTFGEDFEIEDIKKLWEDVQLNLEAGRIRMLFVADEIPPELRAIVEFLNEQMKPAEVLAIEVRQYVGADDVRALVPTTIGNTQKARGVKSRAAKQQLPETWEEALEDVENEQIKPLILEEAQKRGTYPSVRKINYDFQGQRRWRLQVHMKDINVYQMMRFDGDLAFWRDSLPGVPLRTPEDAKRLSFNLSTAEELRRFLDIIQREGPSLNFLKPSDRGEPIITAEGAH